MNNISELSKKNAESFNNFVKEYVEKTHKMQEEINGLKNTISTLQNRLNEVTIYIQQQRIKEMGTGPS